MSEPKFSPSFWFDGPGSTIVISCSTCKACTNYKIVVTGHTGYSACKVLHKIPENIRQQKTYQCEHFVPDLKSKDYDMVMKQLTNTVVKKVTIV